MALRILLPLPERKAASPTDVSRELEHGWAVPTRLRHVMEPRRAALAAFRAAMLSRGSSMAVLGPMGGDVEESRTINLAFDRSPRLSPVRRFASDMEVPATLEGSLVFVCPLLGIVTPLERIPDYRCPAGAKLPKLGSLHFHWRDAVSLTLDRMTRGTEVLSFLPARLAALWRDIPEGVKEVRFFRRSGGRTIGESAAVPRLTLECLRHVASTTSLRELPRFVSSDGHRLVSDPGARLLEFVR